MLSLRSPGSQLDIENPQAVFDDRLFRGSGTSQAAAVVSGSVAAAALAASDPHPGPGQEAPGLGLEEAAERGPARPGRRRAEPDDAEEPADPDGARRAPRTVAPATGLGSLDAARGSTDLVDASNGEVLAGEYDIFGAAWTPVRLGAAVRGRHRLERRHLERHPVVRAAPGPAPVELGGLERHPLVRHPLVGHPLDRCGLDRHPLEREQLDRHPLERQRLQRHPLVGNALERRHLELTALVGRTVGTPDRPARAVSPAPSGHSGRTAGPAPPARTVPARPD